MTDRIDNNKELIKAMDLEELIMHLIILEINNYDKSLVNKKTKYFGGWEVFSERRWIHGGWNYVIKYRKDVFAWRFVLLWGIESPKIRRQKVLYRVTMPRAIDVVTREETSFKTAWLYGARITLYQDFAIEVIDKVLPLVTRSELKPYILVNLHKTIINEENIAKVREFIRVNDGCDVYYVHAWEDDKQLSEIIQKIVPNVKIYDWTQHDIVQIVSFFKNAKAGIGARLHFLMLLKECWVPLEPIVYAEKVKKLILDQ